MNKDIKRVVPEYEIKSIKNAIKDVDPAGRTVTGYFSTFTEDDGADTIQSGAYTRTLKANGPESNSPRILHLYMHDPRQVIGKPSILKEDDKGLYFETKFPDTTLANDILTLYQDKVLTEHSIGFKTIKAEWLTNKDGSPKVNSAGIPRRVIQEVKLYEGSTVSWGMNSNALVTGIKSLDFSNKEEELDYIAEKTQSIEAILHSRSISDEFGIELTITLEQLKSYLTSLSTLEQDSETISATNLKLSSITDISTPTEDVDSNREILLKSLLRIKAVLQ